MDKIHKKKSRRRRKMGTIILSKNNLEQKLGIKVKMTKYMSQGIIYKKKSKIPERRFSTLFFRKKSNYQDILKILASQKEREKEKLRQKIIYKSIKNYAKNIRYNYYVMLISNLITNRPNVIKYKYIELLNVIETKELLSHYYNKYESKFKLVYLTKLISRNTRVFPNYLKNQKIYYIMINYIIKKENMILNAEKNFKISKLKAQLLKYINKDKKKFSTHEKAIESFTDTDSINLENKLFDINNSISYSSSSDNDDTINKVQNLIDDMSILLNKCENNQTNKSIIVKKSSKRIKKIKKNIVKFKSKDFESKTLKDLKEKEDYKKHKIKKMNSLTKFSSFNNNKMINLENLVLRNLNLRKLSTNSDKYKDKKIKIFSSYTQKNENEKKNKSKIKFNSTLKKTSFPPNIRTKGINKDFYLNTITNTNSNNFDIMKTINSINSMKTNKNSNPIKLEKIANTERKNNQFSHFKPTNNFLKELYKKKSNDENVRIKKSIVNLITKFGKSQYENSKIKYQKCIDQTYGVLSNEKLLFENNNNNKNKTKKKKDIRKIKDRNLVGNYIVFDNPNTNIEAEYHYSDTINSEKKNDIIYSKSRTSRLDHNYKTFIIPKLDKKKLTENNYISNSEMDNKSFKFKLKFDEYKDCVYNKVNKEKSKDIYKIDYNCIRTLNNEIKSKSPNILKLRTKFNLNNGISHFRLDKNKIFNLFKN